MREKTIVTLGMIVLIALFSHTVKAGTTGKIAGTVVDAETRDPLPGVNIVLQGTTMGAATDVKGNYTILNVPPGVYTVRVSMMGYRATVVEDVRVSIDLTTTLNVELEETVLEADEEVTIVAERPMVQKDMTSSLSAVNSQEIESLPVQEVSDVLELQAGIVRSGGQLHIRGGRSGEVAYWVDGVATTDVFGGGMGVTVENSAVEELQVVSGTFNAEYGQAMSGIINIITKEGGPKFSGELKAYMGDYYSTSGEFDVLERTEVITDSETGQTQAIGISENPLKKFNPTYNLQGSLSGPIIGNKLTFFANVRYIEQEGYLYGRNWFTPRGTPGDSSLVPMNPNRRLSTQAKLTWKPVTNIKLNYNVFWRDWENDLTWSKNYKYVPHSRPQQFGGGMSHIFSLNHVLSPKTFYELRVNRFYNEYESYLYKDPYATCDYLVSVPEDTANDITAHTFDPTTSEGEKELEQLRNQRIAFDWVIDPNSPPGYVHPDSISAPASYSFNNVGTDLSHFNRSTAYWVGKFDLTSQINQVNQVQAGFEVRLHELELHSFTLRPKLEGDQPIVPFEPDIPPISSIYRSDYVREPREISAYIQNKMETKELILNIGLRFDYFDANSVIPADPSDPNIYAPFKDEHIYKNPDAPEEERVEYTPEERREFMHKEVDPKMQLSPRLGIAYPITDRGVIHFSYGHFFQIPEFRLLYDNPDFKLSSGGGYFIFGNPDLNPQKTVMYEIGLQQQISNDMSVDMTLFYRDVRDWVGTSPLVSTPNPSVKYSQYENKDYSNVRGITAKLTKRYSNNFSARVDYSFQIAEGTYSNPTDAFNAYTANEQPRLALIPLNWDQNHTLNASLVYDYQDWTFSAIGRFWTGRPYTPSFPRGEVVGGAALIGLRENSARLPNQKSVDLYINRRLNVQNVGFNVFFNIYNVFDIQDDTAVYGDTGSAEYTTEINPDRVSYDPKRVGTVQDYVKQPSWYTSPRQIQLGLSLEF